MPEKQRCWWCGDDPVYREYHDREWGRPLTDDHRLFEKICLEGFQSGLSWLTILKKRENFRRAFQDFDPERIARFNTRSVERLLADAGIVRHRGKIESTINNARRYLELAEEMESFAGYIWSFEPGADQRPARLDRETLMELTQSDASKALSRDLKRRGWSFVGPTTLYAFLQSSGVVNDHVEECFARPEVERARRTLTRPRATRPPLSDD